MPEKNEEIKWLKILGDSTQRLIIISNVLDRYSNGFYITGNKTMGDYLNILSEELLDMSENISHASGIVTSEMVNSSSQNSWNVLQAALAGIKIAEESKKFSEEKEK